MAELCDLAKTQGFEVVETFTQWRSGSDTTAYVGAGKREEIRRFVNNETWIDETASADAHPRGCVIDAILVDHEIRRRRQET